MDKSKNPSFFISASLILLGLCAFFFILFIGQQIILPLIFALIIAILLNPFVNYLNGIGINRIISIVISILLMLLLLTALIYLIFSQLTKFSDTWPLLVAKFKELLSQGSAWLTATFNLSPAKSKEWLERGQAQLTSNAGSLLGQTLLTLSSIIVLLVLIPVYTFMFLFYKSLLLEFIKRLFEKDKLSAVAEMLQQSKQLIQNYLVGLLLEAAIVATLNSVGLIILGIQYAVLLGIIGALLNIIPYVGGIIAISLPVIIALVTKTPIYALLVILLYMLVQFIDNNFLVPRVVASKVKINALVSIIVVLIGSALWGVPGMFLALPLTAITKVIFDHIEPLKPWGFLLGDNIPPIGKVIFKFPVKKTKQKIS